MTKRIKLAVAFATGRDNVCKVINAYYKDIIDQIKRFHEEVELTIYILMDTSYQNTEFKDFFKLTPEVYNLDIKYITPENIENEKELLIKKKLLSSDETEIFFGHGHAKCRNTLMYFALKNREDYILFWDDDEYPYAIHKQDKDIKWELQDNILEHLKNIKEANVSIGYHCGYISPIPYMNFEDEEHELILKEFVEAVSNDIVSWESIKEKFENDNGITYSNKQMLDNKIVSEVEFENGGKWVAGSTLCLNLTDINKIPAFYNPIGARGEDTFFSTKLKKSKVVRVPTYHFHDGFLKYTKIMKGELPKKLRKILSSEEEVAQRFLKVSVGWIKYKPLYTYITNKKNYEKIMDEVETNLKLSIPGINEVFENVDFSIVLKEFKKYKKNIKKDYLEYIKTNKIWNKIKRINKKNLSNKN